MNIRIHSSLPSPEIAPRCDQGALARDASQLPAVPQTNRRCWRQCRRQLIYHLQMAVIRKRQRALRGGYCDGIQAVPGTSAPLLLYLKQRPLAHSFALCVCIA